MDNSPDVLELLYFASGVILAGLGLAVFHQLKLAKKSLKATEDNLRIATEALSTSKEDIQIRIEREAVVLSASQCEKFGEKILAKAVAIVDKIRDSHTIVDEWELI